MLADSVSLGRARDWLRRRVDEGAPCPLCTQHAKVYRRAIHAAMARALIVAHARHARDWFSMPELTREIGRGDEGKLRYWGLLEEETQRREDQGRSGWWRVTELGTEFVLEQALVPKYARIYDGRCLGLTGPDVSIRDALGKKFRYDELMRGV